ncbi:hypothetical protein ONZ45_g4877 [Pleurotus djamor]|nr:hypothetical protein ONZ45_g4877 [Pleurotus djamor]
MEEPATTQLTEEQNQWLNQLSVWSATEDMAYVETTLRKAFTSGRDDQPTEWQNPMWLDLIVGDKSFPVALSNLFKNECELRSSEELAGIWLHRESPADFIVRAYKRKVSKRSKIWTIPPVAVPNNVKDAVRKAFFAPFQDTGSLGLLKGHLRCIMDSRMSPILPLIQSSGTGKSRLVNQLAQEWHTFPACVREPNPAGSFCLMYERLQALRQKWGDSPIVVYFDEAHALNSHTIAALTSAFSDLFDSDSGIVAIFISTRPSLLTLVQNISPVNSASRAPRQEVSRPFTELSLDVWDPPPPQSINTLKGLRSVAVTSLLGRPMWRAHLNHNYDVAQLLRLAEYKLAHPGLLSSLLAPVLCRLFAHLGTSSPHLVEDLVERHSAFAFFMNATRTELEVGYPPEPFITAAAARIMMRDMRQNASRVDFPPLWLGELRVSLTRQRLSCGDYGDLTTRVIYTIARDRAYLQTYERDTSSTKSVDVLAGHEPVSLLFFLQFLFGTHWDTIKTCLPCNMEGGQALETYFDKAVVDFTTFTICDDGDIFTLDGMISALRQGCAVVCKRGSHQMYDHVIVVVLDPTKEIGPENLAMIVDYKQTTRIAERLAVEIGIAKASVPVITIVHQYGPQGRTGFKAFESSQLASDGLEQDMPHYQLHLHDCTLIPDTGSRRALLEFDMPFNSYRRAVSEDSHLYHEKYISVRTYE